MTVEPYSKARRVFVIVDNALALRLVSRSPAGLQPRVSDGA
jgi:hypothetical protein